MLILFMSSINVTGGNASWNQSLADTLYADISVTGDNSSWNESYADSLYLPHTTQYILNVSGDSGSGTIFDNEVFFINGLGTVTTAIVGNVLSITGSAHTSGNNDSFNQSLTNSLYAPISTISDNTSWNESYANTLYSVGAHLTLLEVASNVGNWSADKSSYVTGSHTVDTNETPRTNALYANITSFLQDTTYSSLSEFTDDLGNRGYTHLSNFTDNLGHVQDNTSWNKTYADSLYSIGAHTVDTNETVRTDALYANISLFLQDTTYSSLSEFIDDLGHVEDNSSWNQSLADSLYSPIGSSSVWNNTDGNATFLGGRVGIGTSTPNAPLHINSTGGENQGIQIGAIGLFPYKVDGVSGYGQPVFQNQYAENSSTVVRVMPKGTGEAQFEMWATDFYDSGVDPLTLIKIASSIPNQEFEIRSASNGAGAQYPINIYTETNTGQLRLESNGTVNMNGNVGIGTTTPNELLEVAGNINSTGGDICISGGNCLSTRGGMTGYPIYFTCGENSALDNANQEWSCGGNGETKQEVYLAENMTLTNVAMDCNTNTGSANISIRKNLVETSCYLFHTSHHDSTTCNEDFNAGDWWQPYTVTDTGHSQCVVTARFETR